jgi:hypothetical protein
LPVLKILDHILFGFGVQILDCRIEFLEESRVAALGFPSLHADPDPAFHSNADPDPSKNNADTDPQPFFMQIRIRNPGVNTQNRGAGCMKQLPYPVR